MKVLENATSRNAQFNKHMSFTVVLLLLACCSAERMQVILNAGDLPYEVEWDGTEIKLNITSLSRLPINAQLWKDGKIQAFRGTGLHKKGKISWLEITSLKHRDNVVEISWEKLDAQDRTYFDLTLCAAIILCKLLAVFKVKHMDRLFAVLAVSWALFELDLVEFARKLLQIWSLK